MYKLWTSFDWPGSNPMHLIAPVLFSEVKKYSQKQILDTCLFDTSSRLFSCF